MVVVLVLESKVLYWSFSPDVTAWRMFVYKKNPVGFELHSHVKTFYYSKKFAKLLTTWLKTIYWCFWHNEKRRVLKSHCCFLTFLFQNRRGGRGRPVIPSRFYRGGGGWGVGVKGTSPLSFWYIAVFRKDFASYWKAFHLLSKMSYILWVVVLLEACGVPKNGRHLGFYPETEMS